MTTITVRAAAYTKAAGLLGPAATLADVLSLAEFLTERDGPRDIRIAVDGRPIAAAVSEHLTLAEQRPGATLVIRDRDDDAVTFTRAGHSELGYGAGWVQMGEGTVYLTVADLDRLIPFLQLMRAAATPPPDGTVTAAAQAEDVTGVAA